MSDDLLDHLERQANLIDALAVHHDAADGSPRAVEAQKAWESSPFAPGGRSAQKTDEPDERTDEERATALLAENTETLEHLATTLELDAAGERADSEKVWADSSPFAPDGGQ